jgi:hypothetical protein
MAGSLVCSSIGGEFPSISPPRYTHT